LARKGQNKGWTIFGPVRSENPTGAPLRKHAEETRETASETPPAAATPARQPGEEPSGPTQKQYAPDPFPIDPDRLAGTRLLGRGQYQKAGSPNMRTMGRSDCGWSARSNRDAGVWL